MNKLFELRDKVKSRISEHLGFDIQEIFNQGDYITIFGGAVRDSLADMQINDVDILCMPDSAKALGNFITTKHNYTRIELYDQDTLNMYKGVHLISEPWTFINNDKKVIQIIKPSFRQSGDYRNSYINLVKNVDISCCGVYLEHNGYDIVLMEACKNAIIHCLSKTFEKNEWSALYNRDRTDFREHKLLTRGWTNLRNIRNNAEILRKKRMLKISSLGFPEGDRYKVWTKDEYKGRKIFDNDDVDDDNLDDLPF